MQYECKYRYVATYIIIAICQRLPQSLSIEVGVRRLPLLTRGHEKCKLTDFGTLLRMLDRDHVPFPRTRENFKRTIKLKLYRDKSLYQ